MTEPLDIPAFTPGVCRRIVARQRRSCREPMPVCVLVISVEPPPATGSPELRAARRANLVKARASRAAKYAEKHQQRSA